LRIHLGGLESIFGVLGGRREFFACFFLKKEDFLRGFRSSLNNGLKDLYRMFIYLHLYSNEENKMVQKNVTLSLDEKTYEKYREFCKKNAVALSRSIEVFMEEKTKRGGK